MTTVAGNYIVVMTTCGGEEEAEQIAARLVEQRLAACVQLSQIWSVYRWQGKIKSNEEVRLLIKARQEDFLKIEATIRELHSYAVPEVISLPIEAASDGYLAWMESETAQ